MWYHKFFVTNDNMQTLKYFFCTPIYCIFYKNNNGRIVSIISYQTRHFRVVLNTARPRKRDWLEERKHAIIFKIKATAIPAGLSVRNRFGKYVMEP